MRIQVELRDPLDRDMSFPLHYNRALQGLIYSLVQDEHPNLHDQGFVHGNRKFKLFVFSRLLGKVKHAGGGRISFSGPVSLQFASPYVALVETMANKLIRGPVLRIGDQDVVPASFKVIGQPQFNSGSISIHALSPITVYSTLATADGKKKTYYYHPSEPEFQKQIYENLLKKAAVLGIPLREADSHFRLFTQRVDSKNQKIVYFGDTLIKGWIGSFIMEGDPNLLAIAYDTGLGAKNSQGFGMIEING